MKDVSVLTVDWVGSLYDPESSHFISRIENLLSTAASGSIVLLRAPSACHDYHRHWLEGVTSKLYWEDLAAHFQRVHLALVGICLSKARWFFISGDDCLGSWWDLALACHGRIWTNPYAKIGFPEAYIDLLPPLATGALRRFEAYDSIDLARKNAIMHAKDAYVAGLISLVLKGEDWAQDSGIDALYSWIKKTPLPNNLRSTTKKDLLTETPDILGVVESRSVLSHRRRQIALSHLEASFVALKERNIAARAIVMSQIRAGCAARVLFEDYRSWLSRRISRYELGSRDRWWTAGDGIVVIDISSGIPPQSILYALLSRKIKLVLLAKNETSLKESLETILSRSQKNGTSRRDTMATWQGRLDWFVGDVATTNCLWLACPSNDFVEIGTGTKKLITRYRLSGNFGHANLGWSESLSGAVSESSDANSDLMQAANEIADMLTNGVLHRLNWPHDVSLSVALRYALLSEMMRLSDTGKWPDVVEQCKLLASAGWGFAGDIPQWDGLLRNFPRNSALSGASVDIGVNLTDFPPNTSIADLRQRAPKESHVSRLEISAARLSRHFEAYAVQLAGALSRKKFVESTAMADLFVTLALGYPGKSPVPSELATAMGPARIDLWMGGEKPLS